MKVLTITKKIALTAIILGMSITLVACGKNNKVNPQVNYDNQEHSLIMPLNVNQVKINSSSYDLYKTTNEVLTLHFQALNFENEYDNKLKVNDKTFNLKLSDTKAGEYIKQSIKLNSQNVINGTLKIEISTGLNEFLTYDNFTLRNVYITLGDKEIWSEEFSEANTFNTALNFGKDLTSDYRDNYLSSRTFTFKIEDSLLNVKGIIFTSNEPQFLIEYNDKKESFENQQYIEINHNLTNQMVIKDDFNFDINFIGATSYKVSLDGFEIRSDFKLSKNAWSKGLHHLEITAKNSYGYQVTEHISFELDNPTLETSSLSYKAYNPGIDATLTDNLPTTLGLLIDPLQSDINFSKSGIMYLSVDVNADKTIYFEAESIKNRKLVMQAYNTKTNKFDNVSTSNYSDHENETLGFDYSLYQTDYIKDNKVIIRIGSINDEELLIDNEIFHITDIQYMTRYLTASGQVLDNAKLAFTKMIDYIKKSFDNNNLLYIATSGDYVQTMRNQALEWEAVNTHFFQHLFNYKIPFGVLSGNHDVGGTSDNPNSNDGSNTLDDLLIYEYFSQHLGENKFKNSPWYQSSYKDNRSHSDVIKINNQEFMFLYLGWGSNAKGIHVSNQDINYAKSILDSYDGKNVVLIVHEYLGNQGSRNTTGNKVYTDLVEKYSQIKIVLSGHINGTASRIDYLDDNKDGIKDRSVLQIVTDFQEEENLFGASWIRKIGFDYTNNKIYFSIYSPYMNDYDILVNANHEVVNKNKSFVYDYDLNNLNKTMSVGMIN